jgi:CheY-like chemotaxis protein/anti-sigma regulatory factor (Ser/Thr protein kinase)
MLGVQARAKKLEVTCKIAEDVPDWVSGDPIRLAQVFNNLLSNAIKFTDRGTIEVVLTAGDRESDRAAVSMSVRDTGIGIEPAKQSMIFESFSQADASTTRRYGGTGLGLAITSRLVQLMGGRIRVDSEPGAGSTFSFTAWFGLLPDDSPRKRVVPDTAGIQQLLTSIDGATAAVDPVSPGPGEPGMRVLAAEDNPVNRKVVTKLLEKLGCSVDMAENGRDAVEKWSHGSYEMVLMDVQMPEMDGFEATNLIREAESAESRAYTYILGVTAHALPADRDRCLRAGMDAHLPKPLTLDSLATALAQHRAFRRMAGVPNGQTLE